MCECSGAHIELEGAVLECSGELHRRDRIVGVKHRDAKMHFIAPRHGSRIEVELTREPAGVATPQLEVEPSSSRVRLYREMLLPLLRITGQAMPEANDDSRGNRPSEASNRRSADHSALAT